MKLPNWIDLRLIVSVAIGIALFYWLKEHVRISWVGGIF